MVPKNIQKKGNVQKGMQICRRFFGEVHILTLKNIQKKGNVKKGLQICRREIGDFSENFRNSTDTEKAHEFFKNERTRKLTIFIPKLIST